MRALRHLDYPPAWLALFMALAWMVALVHAPLGGAFLWPGAALVVGALALMVWAAMAFRRVRTTIVPHREPDALVETGPYRISRNPIYVADLAIFVGWCLALGAPLALLLTVPLWWALRQRFVLPEERRLDEHLGAPYDRYRARVRRWL